MTSEHIRKYYEKRLPELPSRVSGSGEVSVRCPFHPDSNPSMNVNLGTGCWYCHAEKIGGNLFQFEQRLTGCDYVTALKNVSAITGCDLLPPSNGWRLEDVYPYPDEDGKTLYEVVRCRDQGATSKSGSANLDSTARMRTGWTRAAKCAVFFLICRM